MKKIILVRHAKSSWDDASISDFDRPLNDRGRRDAPMMAARLLEKKIGPDAFVSSPAVRARTTAEVFAQVFGLPKNRVLLRESLYMAAPDDFRAVLKNLDNSIQTVALFSHNPGITVFANQFRLVQIDNMPTCSIFAVRAELSQWKDFSTDAASFLFFDFPKKQ